VAQHGNAPGRVITVRDDETWVRLRTVRTAKGARVAIQSPAPEVGLELDPLAVESVTWQTRDVLEPLHEQIPAAARDDSDPPAVEDGIEEVETVRLVNEFADVRIETTPDDDSSVKATATKLGYSIRLDATDLVALASQGMEVFSEFLAEPFGPIEGDYHGSPG